MNLKITIRLFILFFFIALSTHAQRSDVFRHLNTSQGLSHNRITCIIQNKEGFIWVGTEDGLNRYNGYKVDVYKHDPSDGSSISNSGIRCLFEDSKGMLWAGTDDGLNYFDITIEKFKTYKLTPGKNSISSNQITCMSEDANGNLWVGTAGGGLSLYNLSKQEWKTFKNTPGDASSICSNNITAITKDKNNVIYVGTDKGLAIADKNQLGKFSIIAHDPANNNTVLENEITSLYADFQDKIWIGTLNSGLSAMTTTGQFTHYTNLGSSGSNVGANSVFGICKDLDGTIIVATIGGGLMVLNTGKNVFTAYTHDKLDPFSVSSNNIWCVYRDKSGLIWIGTDNGVDYYKEDLMRFKTESPLGAADVIENVPLNKNTFCALTDNSGNTWLGILGSGIVVKDKTGNVIGSYNMSNGLCDNNVLSLYQDKQGIVWAGTYNGLTSIDRKNSSLKIYRNESGNVNSLSNNNIRAIAEDASGNIWIGTYGGGLNKLNRQTGTFTAYRQTPGNTKGLANDIVTALIPDNNILYVATFGGGLSTLNISANTFTNYAVNASSQNSISSNFINCIYTYTNNKLLIGTYGGGMSVLDKATGTFKRYTERNGLPNNNITNITIDSDNMVWITTGNQIGKLKLNEADSLLNVRIYDEQDGVFNRFNAGACTRSADGRIIFGGNNGINKFLPAAIKDNPYAPPVVITKFFLFEKPYFTDTIIMAKNIIELTYNQNFFAFEFAALNYILPEKNQYAYMLEGLEKDWTYCGTRRDRQYTDLDPGTYRFRVKAANNDGIWNEEGTFITLRIRPPFWKTWWFYILSALAFAGLTVAYIRWRTRTLMKQYEILEERVTVRTAELRDEKEKSEHKSIELERTVKELKDTQSQLIHAEKMASLGQLTAGIAHEIQNPLNFVNNFSELSKEMMDELANTPAEDEKEELIYDIRQNLLKINEHGKRAERIVKSMLMHSRTRTADKALTDINKLAEDALNLSYTSLRARDHNFGCENIIELDSKVPQLDVVQQDISRVLLNIFNNAFYAVNAMRKKEPPTYKPVIKLKTSLQGKRIIISITDNGGGIPEDIVDKIFQPFFTTKPTGEGTGLGLSLSYDIITKGHNGFLKVNVIKNTSTEFVIELPVN